MPFTPLLSALILRTIAIELVDTLKKAVSGHMPSISPFGASATCSTTAGWADKTDRVAREPCCVQIKSQELLKLSRQSGIDIDDIDHLGD